MKTIIAITGANSGLGAALVERFAGEPDFEVIDINGPNKEGLPGFDFTDEEDVFEASEHIRSVSDDIYSENPDEEFYHVLINCAGVNYIEWFPEADFEQFDRLMAINVRSQMQLVQDLVKEDGVRDITCWFDGNGQGNGAVLNIVSNASHMAMTNSAFYNATKGAMHVGTLSLARELRKTHGITVFGISPNKLKGTEMSSYIEGVVPDLRGWTPEEAAAYQLSALPAGEETCPVVLADFIAYLFSSFERHKFLTNTILPYGA